MTAYRVAWREYRAEYRRRRDAGASWREAVRAGYVAACAAVGVPA